MAVESICTGFRSKYKGSWRAAALELVELVAHEKLDASDLALIARAIAESGERIALPADGVYSDIPSTGGPASLSTLVCPVLLAASGVRVPKISATGSVAGGIDTLQLIPGYRADLHSSEFLRVLSDVGLVHVAQNFSLCPADAVLVAIRRERGMMADPQLAAVSLLAKKVAVAGSGGLFDFRVGSTGNVGATAEAARSAADLFHDVASVLGVRIGTALTDNSVFPSSALGRLESLDLLVSMLGDGADRVAIDQLHLHTCKLLAGAALELAMDVNESEASRSIADVLRKGTCMDLFLDHLSAQGSSEEALNAVLSVRLGQEVRPVQVTSSGYWAPPALSKTKEWIKARQAECGSDAQHQIGVRLLLSPGAEVSAGDTVIEVRGPLDKALRLPSWLAGRVSDAPTTGNGGVLAMRLMSVDWRTPMPPSGARTSGNS